MSLSVYLLAECRTEELAPKLSALGFIRRVKGFASRFGGRLHLLQEGIKVVARPALGHIDRGITRIRNLGHDARPSVGPIARLNALQHVHRTEEHTLTPVTNAQLVCCLM